MADTLYFETFSAAAACKAARAVQQNPGLDPTYSLVD
jgi:hypothetical protein